MDLTVVPSKVPQIIRWKGKRRIMTTSTGRQSLITNICKMSAIRTSVSPIYISTEE